MSQQSSDQPGCCSGLVAACTSLFKKEKKPNLAKAVSFKVGAPFANLKDIIHRQDEDALPDYLMSVRPPQQSAGEVPSELLESLRVAVRQGSANAVTSSQSMALHEAIRCGYDQVVADLLKAGAFAEAQNGSGQSAVDVAEACGARKALLTTLRRERDRRRMSEFNDDLAWIPKVKLFERLQPSEYPRLAAAFTSRRYAKGETVVREGEPGHELFLIQSGWAKVVRADQEQATLGPGAHFGEVALLTDAPRNATVVAADELSVKKLTRAEFESLELKRKLKARKAIRQADEQRRKTEFKLLQKSDAEAEFIKDSMQRNEHLGPLLKALEDEAFDEIIAQAFRVEVAAGDSVVTQGDLFADLFYVIHEGSFDVIKDGENIIRLQPGMSFGELALLYREPRAATVKAASQGRLWAVSRQELREAMQAPLRKKLEGWASLLDAVDILKDVPAEEKRSLADALVETTFYVGECIIRQGEVGKTFYILQEGEVKIEVDGKIVGHEIRAGQSPTSEASKGCFGERALLEDEPRAASVVAVSPKVTVLALDRGVFTRVVKRRDSLLPSDGMVTYAKDQLRELGVLGYGGFGVVSLVKCNLTNRTFALKAISKGHILQQQQEKSIMNEKHILRMTNCPFLVRLAATFNGSNHLYFLLEPALGGELFTIYQRRKHFYGSQKHARFYIACVLLAFEHLHQRLIVYRDLKPENVLLDTGGYAKVTDFGLAKFVVGHTYTTCGTPDYFAPEMVMGSGHTLAVDWWTLGVMTYELMISDAPFSADEPMLILRKVKRGIEHAKFPNRSAPWAQLVMNLCKQVPSERLPMRRGGAGNVKECDWFKEASFNWQELEARKMTPPYIPEVNSEFDLSNFETFGASDGPPQVPYRDPGTKWDKDFEDPVGPRLD